MKTNINNKKTNNKVKFSDKMAGVLFEQIIDTLISKYHKSDEKETMTFEEYCISLKELSINERKKKGESN